MRHFQGAFRENPQFFSLKTCARINYFIYYSKRQRFFFFLHFKWALCRRTRIRHVYLWALVVAVALSANWRTFFRKISGKNTSSKIPFSTPQSIKISNQCSSDIHQEKVDTEIMKLKCETYDKCCFLFLTLQACKLSLILITSHSRVTIHYNKTKSFVDFLQNRCS